jgi:hypothetical protein
MKRREIWDVIPIQGNISLSWENNEIDAIALTVACYEFSAITKYLANLSKDEDSKPWV